MQKVQEKEQPTRPLEKEVKQETKLPSGGDGERVWGSVLRKLRTDKEIMLWVACQDVSVKQEGGTVIVCAPGENEYSLLSKTENQTKLLKYVQAEGANNLKVVKDLTESIQSEQTDEEVNAVKEFFNGETVNFKE